MDKILSKFKSKSFQKKYQEIYQKINKQSKLVFATYIFGLSQTPQNSFLSVKKKSLQILQTFS